MLAKSAGLEPLASRHKQSAFSLVEVVLAVGVVAFAFVGLLGLLPAGMTQFRGAMDGTTSTEIAHQVIGDARQMDFDLLIDKAGIPSAGGDDYFTFRAPKVSQPEFRYFDEQGGEVIPVSTAARSNPGSLSAEEKERIVYHVLVRVMPRTRLPITIPGSSGGNEVATVTVQVARNPSNQRIQISNAGKSDGTAPDRQLFAKTPGVSVLTYSAQIARNQ